MANAAPLEVWEWFELFTEYDSRLAREDLNSDTYKLLLRMTQLMRELKGNVKQINEQQNYINELEETVRILGDDLEEKSSVLQQQQDEISNLTTAISTMQTQHTCKVQELLASQNKELDLMMQEIINLDGENRRYIQRIQELQNETNDLNSKILDMQIVIRELEVNKNSSDAESNSSVHLYAVESSNENDKKVETVAFPPLPPPFPSELEPTTLNTTDGDDVKVKPPLIPSRFITSSIPRSEDDSLDMPSSLASSTTFSGRGSLNTSDKAWAVVGKMKSHDQLFKLEEDNKAFPSSQSYFQWETDPSSASAASSTRITTSIHLPDNVGMREDDDDDDSVTGSPSRNADVVTRVIRKVPMPSSNNAVLSSVTGNNYSNYSNSPSDTPYTTINGISTSISGGGSSAKEPRVFQRVNQTAKSYRYNLVATGNSNSQSSRAGTPTTTGNPTTTSTTTSSRSDNNDQMNRYQRLGIAYKELTGNQESNEKELPLPPPFPATVLR